jgi:hypothetical protein
VDRASSANSFTTSVLCSFEAQAFPDSPEKVVAGLHVCFVFLAVDQKLDNWTLLATGEKVKPELCGALFLFPSLIEIENLLALRQALLGRYAESRPQVWRAQ